MTVSSIGPRPWTLPAQGPRSEAGCDRAQGLDAALGHELEQERSAGSAPCSAVETFRAVRARTEQLTEPLQVADFEAQSMSDASPTKWHLAHTSWFFEEFVLRAFEANFKEFHPRFGYLFNSYYNAVGARQLRSERGLLTRPSLDVIRSYRRTIDERVAKLVECGEPRVHALVELGCHHEQQHQELILTDLKHLFSKNALLPSYVAQVPRLSVAALPLEFVRFDGCICHVGAGPHGFAFDNERPRHRVFLEPFELGNRLVTNREFAEFIEDGGYQTPALWLDQGFQIAQTEGWTKPLYWLGETGSFSEFTLAGERELVPDEPVSHISLFEADAFARWAGARLCREHEWEHAAKQEPISGNFVDARRFHPAPAEAHADSARGRALLQCFGDLWEWTQSPYVGYPGYSPPEGAVGEYNGKFMCNQFVLRGGSCVTSRAHLRASYRNFFYAKDRWQFTGVRLARDA